MKYLNDSGLTYLWGKITDAISAAAASASGGIASIKQILNSTSSEAFNIDSNNALLTTDPNIASSAKYVPDNTGVYVQGDYGQVVGKDIVIAKPILKRFKISGQGHLVRATSSNANAVAGHDMEDIEISGYRNLLETRGQIQQARSIKIEGSTNRVYLKQPNTSNTAISGVHIEGLDNVIDLTGTNTSFKNIHIEGYGNEAVPASTAEQGVHIEGFWNELKHTLAGTNTAVHIEGYMNRTQSNSATSRAMHIEGGQNHFLASSLGAAGAANVNNPGFHMEGWNNSAVAYEATHIEGKDNYCTGKFVHVEGIANTCSSPEGGHIEGGHNTSLGSYSHVEGQYNIASSTNQHVEGKYNIADANNDFAHIVGNGTADDARSNAYTLDWNGNGWYQGTVEATGLILKSSTANSDKRFLITVDDSGILTATEIVAVAGGEE